MYKDGLNALYLISSFSFVEVKCFVLTRLDMQNTNPKMTRFVLQVALFLGVEVHEGVSFEELLEPTVTDNGESE